MLMKVSQWFISFLFPDIEDKDQSVCGRPRSAPDRQLFDQPGAVSNLRRKAWPARSEGPGRACRFDQHFRN